eukprot:TRINITY_DN7823_c0_g3_i1.p1 TRINITY_DN7823_c0_g3~~TRINITY_DN7823_c0_g3_i1.p1  ORF type:complete len:109 (+),score=3.50 TRINITY_DN7823_c0_g3_i1:255-581(+)
MHTCALVVQAKAWDGSRWKHLHNNMVIVASGGPTLRHPPQVDSEIAKDLNGLDLSHVYLINSRPTSQNLSDREYQILFALFCFDIFFLLIVRDPLHADRAFRCQSPRG